MANALARETSPYLLQHAENPVDWRPWSEQAFAEAAAARRAGAGLDRLLLLPLVPRDGARVLRGRGDGGGDERALRVREGRPRGAPRRRRALHGGRAGDDRSRRLAAQRVPHARADPVLRRHLLPARAASRDAGLDAGPAGDLGVLAARTARRSARAPTACASSSPAPAGCSRASSRSARRISTAPSRTCARSTTRATAASGRRRSSRRPR